MNRKTHPAFDPDNELAQTEQALCNFIEAHGTPGIMPTSAVLRQAGRRDLNQAINKIGGYVHVATRLGLEMQYTRKPGNYWSDFVHVEMELLAFIEEHGTSGVMPIKEELLQAGRGDLAKAINKHGGIEAVAEHLELQHPSYKRKPRGYWEDFDNVAHELQNFIAEHGNPGVMPTQQELKRVKQHGLAIAIDNHGGFSAVAERLRLQLSYTRKPTAYWDNFSNVEDAICAFIKEHGLLGRMPTRSELRKAGQSDLDSALNKYGGSKAVAERLGFECSIKPMGYWDDFANVAEALQTFIQEQGTPSVMPTNSELQRAGQSSLAGAIKKHGGISAVAERVGLRLSYTAKPGGYWDDITTVENELRSFIEAEGKPGIMPTSGALQKAGRGDLVTAITNHGGFPALAERFGFVYSYTAKPDRYWSDFANIQREIFDFIQAQGSQGIMPTSIELSNASKHSLAAAINAHGGFHAVAERLKLIATTKPNGYWNNFANLEQELLAFIQEHGKPGVMPTHQEFYSAKRSDLPFAIAKHGGVATVRKRLGLQPPAKRPGLWDDFSRVEQEIRLFLDRQGKTGIMPTREQLKQGVRHSSLLPIKTEIVGTRFEGNRECAFCRIAYLE
jgi:hypothetical protein